LFSLLICKFKSTSHNLILWLNTCRKRYMLENVFAWSCLLCYKFFWTIVRIMARIVELSLQSEVRGQNEVKLKHSGLESCPLHVLAETLMGANFLLLLHLVNQNYLCKLRLLFCVFLAIRAWHYAVWLRLVYLQGVWKCIYLDCPWTYDIWFVMIKDK
jgi:hypothetical protein